MKTRALIFDIGNVLLRLDYSRAQRILREASAPTPNPQALATLAQDYERGRMETEDFLAALSGIYGGAVNRDVLTSAWLDMFEPNLPMWRVVSACHGRFPLYLLSNTNALHHGHIERTYAVFEKFSDGVFSYQEGLLKPEPEIYERAIRKFEVEPEETLYIDDLAPNVEGARAAGLRAISYDPDAHGDLLAVLRSEGLSLDDEDSGV